MSRGYGGLIVGLLAITTVPVYAGAVITNGTGIYLGVNDYGNLNYTDGVTTTVNGTFGAVGVAVDADLSAFGRGAGLFDATSPGCLCEGWGASANGISGYSGIDLGGTVNLGLVNFTSTASTATSVTTVGGTALQVTQAFAASASNDLMQVTVTLANTGAGTLTDVRYNRTMDWDVPPGEFFEFVEIFGWPATALLRTTDNGFSVPDPLNGGVPIACPVDANFTACGPADHGAFFTFGFGDLGAGESVTFNIFYGAATSRSGALGALASVGAEVYSLGMYGSGGTSLPLGEPLTYAFGFSGVGGEPISGVPEPGTYAMMGLGLGALALIRKRVRK